MTFCDETDCAVVPETEAFAALRSRLSAAGVSGMRLVFDSNLDVRILNMPSNDPLNAKFLDVPEDLVNVFAAEPLAE